MSALKSIGIGLLFVLVILFTGSWFLPSQIHVATKVTIHAPVEEVYQQVNNLKNWQNWSPWTKGYEEMSIDYNAVTVGEGASYKWKSKASGSGGLQIIETESPHYIKTEFDFSKQGTSVGEWMFEQKGDSSIVVLSVESDIGNNPISKYMGFMMKGMIKSDFQRGLANMKELLEKE